MRASILFWSVFSGVLLGLFVDALLVGIWLVLSSFLPGAKGGAGRAILIPGVIVLTLMPVIGAVLGLLEGRLKTH